MMRRRNLIRSTSLKRRRPPRGRRKPKPGPRGDDHRQTDQRNEESSHPCSYDEEEPLSIAEEIAAGARNCPPTSRSDTKKAKQPSDTHIVELQKISMAELIEAARNENVAEYAGNKRQELIFKILRGAGQEAQQRLRCTARGRSKYCPTDSVSSGSPDYHYLSCPDDIYVSPSQIRRFGPQDQGNGFQADSPAQGERALLRPLASGGDQLSGPEPEALTNKVPFDEPRRCTRTSGSGTWRSRPTKSA